MAIIIMSLAAAALFLLQQRLYAKLWNKEVAVSLRFRDDTVRAGEQTVLAEVVENRKILPLPALKVKFHCSSDLIFERDENAQVSDMYYRNDLFSLMPYRRITRKHRITCARRGYYGIRGIDLVGADLFFSKEMVESRRGETWIHVLPAFFQSERLDVALRQVSGELAHRRHLLTDPFAFRGIREYTPFDEIKSVNWKASAKSDELKVNVHDYTAVSAVSIFVNVNDWGWSGSAGHIEKAISIAFYLCSLYLHGGVGVSLYVNGRDALHGSILCLEENRDHKQLEQIGKMLARIDLRQGAEPFGHFLGQLNQQTDRMIIIISPDWLDDVQKLLCQLDSRRDFIWICPCHKETDVKVRPELEARTILLPDPV